MSPEFERARELLESEWEIVTAQAVENPKIAYLDDAAANEAIHHAVNHNQVSYRFCLPVQLTGKMAFPAIDCLRLQKRDDPKDTTGWDARSLASKVIAPFNQRQECVLGSSSDPYVGNPMRIPRMERDDRSKKDQAGWNSLVDLLNQVQSRSNPDFTKCVFRQVLLAIFRRQQALRFPYPLPGRASLESTLRVMREFLETRSGGDRALSLAGALFEAIGIHFKLFQRVARGRINASDEATGQAADLECWNESGELVMAVEVKDRKLTLADVQGTIRKSRERAVRNILFTTPAVRTEDQSAIQERISQAFAGGQNLYVFELLELAKSVFALGGEPMRQTFLAKVGEHLDGWNTQPKHRQEWKNLLASL